MPTHDQIDEIAANRDKPENIEAFEIITIALGVERLAVAMRLGHKDHIVAAFEILKLIKELPGLPE